MTEPTELQRVLWALDGHCSAERYATRVADAARLLRAMAKDFEALTRYVKDSQNEKAVAARARWRLSE